MDYAESHAQVMQSVADLHIIRFDRVFAKNGHVLLRYSAEGSFCGEPYMGIPANGNKASWSAAAIFEVEDGKIKHFTKDWDQKVMQVYYFKELTVIALDNGGHADIFLLQIQLGWAPVKASDNPRWNVEALANLDDTRKKTQP